MNVATFLASEHQTAFSFEVLPPMRGKGIGQIFKNIDRLKEFNPVYINITTHRSETIYREVSEGVFQRAALRRRPGTVAIAAAIEGRFNIPAVPHIICSGFTQQELENELIDLSYLGITNIFVLRGDREKGENRFIPMQSGHEHAAELCRQVSAFNAGKMLDDTSSEPLAQPFSFGVAGYPEKHEEAMNIETDIEHLKEKIDAGAQYIVTQMFFDNKKYFDFVKRCREADITVPIIPGIKPLTSLTQQSLLPRTFHIDFPQELSAELKKCHSQDDVKELGVEWAILQARELKAANVPSIHFYSMNATASIEKIAKEIY